MLQALCPSTLAGALSEVLSKFFRKLFRDFFQEFFRKFFPGALDPQLEEVAVNVEHELVVGEFGPWGPASTTKP